MIKRFAAIGADGLARGRPAREHERSAGLCMGGKDGKHRALVVGSEVEEAVPGDDPAEAATEVEPPHVAYAPVVLREARYTQSDQRM